MDFVKAQDFDSYWVHVILRLLIEYIALPYQAKCAITNNTVKLVA
jgi:hypothetical protein